MVNFLYQNWVQLIIILSFTKLTAPQNGRPWIITNDYWYNKHFDKTANILYIQIPKLQKLASTYCDRLPNIQDFNAKSLSLTTIEPKAFKNCKHLIRVDLYYNNIQSIHPNTFEYNFYLQYVSLFSNELTEIPYQLFKHNLKLNELNLEHNKLRSFPVAQMNILPVLAILKLQGNSLKDYDKKSFKEKFPVLKKFSIELVLDEKDLNKYEVQRDVPKVNKKFDICWQFPEWILIFAVVLAFGTICVNTIMIFGFCKEFSKTNRNGN